MDYLISFLARILAWVLLWTGWAVVQVVKLVFDGLLAVFSAIPLCPCFATASAALSAMPPDLAYFIGTFHIAEGLATVLCCWCLRFLIRRIPVIG